MKVSEYNKRCDKADRVVRDLISKGKIEEADKYAENSNYVDETTYYNLRLVFIKKKECKIEEKLDELSEFLQGYEFDVAKEYYLENKSYISEDKYEQLLNSTLERQEKENMAKKLIEMKIETRNNLKKALTRTITEADEMFHNQNYVSAEEYENMRDLQVKEFIDSTIDIPLNSDQLSAISTIDSNILLKARAGSGKTSVVTAKTYFLIEKEKVNPDEIMLLAFNKKAANEMTARIRKKYHLPSFNNARTFHSLANQLTQPSQDLLYDESDTRVCMQKQSAFIQTIVKENMNEAFKQDMLDFFKSEMKEMENIGEFMSNKDYLTFRRNLTHITLNNNRVKSNGEKYIADFLFEHGINYQYEKPYYWVNDIYRPDFSIFTNATKENIIIEHWGIDENDRSKSVPEDWDKTWDEYHLQMQRKRYFWNDKKNIDNSYSFIETSIADLKYGRDEFEKRLSERLTDAGIVLQKLSEEAIFEKITTIHITKLTEMFMSYIQKAKKNRLTPEVMQSKIDNIITASRESSKSEGKEWRTREIIFITMANYIYKEYINRCKDQNKIDFDDLLELAIKKIDDTQGNCGIRNFTKLNQHKWIMIDEYQDFSPMFYEMIRTIIKYNPDVKLMCVGDDWQAINAFAGSDLKYFSDVENYIPNIKKLKLLTNYRSKRNIVEFANDFMNGKGDKSESFSKESGEIYKLYTDGVWLEQRKDEIYKEYLIEDSKFKHSTKDRCNVNARILKALYTIITDKENKDKTIAVISRIKVDKIGQKLKNVFRTSGIHEEFQDKLTFGTIHNMKGLEADIVIMLNVNQSQIPLIHPDNALHYIFGVTFDKVLAEEQRLFYVAITRAKEKLFFFTDDNKESGFIKDNKTIKEYKNINLEKRR